MKHKSQIIVTLVWVICLFLIPIACSNNSEDGWNPFLSSSGTGVRGLDTPDQILSNPYVEDALNDAATAGATITPERDISPPVITGTYDLSGEACYPGSSWHQLASGEWKWKNQTADNHIDTEYDQFGIQSGSGGGEIIRGEGANFTVYSVMNISQSGCSEQAISIVDGRQLNNGDVAYNYIVTPTQANSCYRTTIGRVNLELTGSAKTTSNASQGSPIMISILDSFSEVNSKISH